MIKNNFSDKLLHGIPRPGLRDDHVKRIKRFFTTTYKGLKNDYFSDSDKYEISQKFTQLFDEDIDASKQLQEVVDQLIENYYTFIL